MIANKDDMIIIKSFLRLESMFTETFNNIIKDNIKIQKNDHYYFNPTDNFINQKTNTSFYNKNPFPNYEDGDDIAKLIDKNNSNDFSFSLINAINYKKNFGKKIRILEVGCGTGQLSNLISKLSDVEYYATDVTINSLKIASNFASKNNIDNINFYLMDIFNPFFKDNSFDIIISNGVLHHTQDPYLAFINCTKLLKSDGIILVGLYNKIGRFKNSIIKFIYKLTNLKLVFNLDFIYRNIKNLDKKNAWLMDQYFHPQEKRFSYQDLYIWFKKNKIIPIRFIPDIRDVSIRFENIFTHKNEFSKISNFLNEIEMFFFNKEGGLFILIGSKDKNE